MSGFLRGGFFDSHCSVIVVANQAKMMMIEVYFKVVKDLPRPQPQPKVQDHGHSYTFCWATTQETK